MNESTNVTARDVYAVLIETMRDMGWAYEETSDLQIAFSAQGNDIPMNFSAVINESKEIVILYSFLPISVDGEMLIMVSDAVCSANYRLADGSFDFDVTTGQICFRITANYRDSLIGKDLFEYMIRCSCATVDRYNDKLLMLSRGIMSIEDFRKEIGFQ